MIKPFFYTLGVVALIAATVALFAPPLSKEKWVEQAKLSIPSGLEYFGQDIAIDQDTAVVGAPGYRLPSIGYYGGTAFVYTYSGNTWSEQAKLFLPQTLIHKSNSFGSKVAIDGDTILLTADMYTEDEPKKVPLFVFTRKENTWSLQAQLKLPYPAELPISIDSVALEGNTAVATGSEGPLVFRRDQADGTWSYEANLKRTKSSDKQCKNSYFATSLYGNTVAISGDTIMINGGCAYVFVRQGATSSWSLQAQLPPYPRTLSSYTTVALSGNTAVVGSTGDDGERGAAYVYQRDQTTGRWSKPVKLVPNDVPPLLTFGFGASVAIDGNTIVVGCNRHAIQAMLLPSWTQRGAYVFVRRTAANSWSQPVKLIPRNYNKNISQLYGQKVDISGERVIVNGGVGSNTVYIFQRVEPQKSAN